MEDNGSYIEKYIKDFAKSRTRMFITIFSIISVIFVLLFMTENKLNAITMIYAIFMLCAGIAVVIYASDIYNKNKYRNDILICGLALNLTGFLLRVIKLGIIFSIRYFIGYCALACVIILMIIKLSKNNISEKPIVVFLVIMTLYCLFEFLYTNILFINGFTAAMYRISEVTLLLAYISILITNKADYQEFSEKVGNYKTQIPSLKICLGIFMIIAVTAIGIGIVKNIDKIHFNRNTTEKIEKIEKAEKTEDKVESDKIKKNETITSTKEQNESVSETTSTSDLTKEPIPTISLGETVKTDSFEFTLNKVELSYNVEPDNPPSYYTYYAASDGQVYVYVNATVKNLTQQTIRCDGIYSVMANYNNGYTYKGFNIITDTDGDFTYSNINSITPLQTMGIHCLIDCPKEVETSGNPLALTIKLRDGKEYLYTVR